MSEQKKTWLSVEIVFHHENEIKRLVARNWDWQKVKLFRDNVFQCGYMFPVDPLGSNHFAIASPNDIISIDIYRQDHFLKDY